MAIGKILNQREFDKFTEPTTGITAVNTFLSGGTVNVAGSSATIYVGTSMVTVTLGTALSSAIDSVSLGAATVFIGLATVVIGLPGVASRATVGQASVSTTPVQVLAADSNTITTFIQNISNTTVFISTATGSCNASLGIMLTQRDNLQLNNFNGTWFAATGAGSGEVRYLRDLL